MRLDQLVVGLAGLTVVAASWWIGLGSELGPSLVLVGFLFVLALAAGARLASDLDPWLRLLLPVAFIAKMAATFARWGMVQILYGFGDSVSYHAAGIRFAADWSAFRIPEIIGRSMGTRFVENVTALLYAPFEPHMLGGFFYFGTFAFVGQTLFYLAYRRAFGRRYLKPYAFFVFFSPTLAFWPSSIGKDALMIGFLGVVFYGTSRLLERIELRNVIIIGLGLWGTAVIRSHVALLAATSVAITILVMRKPAPGVSISIRRLAFLGIALVGALSVATLFADTFGLGEAGDGLLSIDLTIEDLDPVVADIERRTGQGASSVDAGAIDSIVGLPAAFGRVLFAPFPWQAHNAQAFFAAAEGLVMFGVFLWGLPAIISVIGAYRRNPYLMLSFVFTLGFSIAFSAILNLGIMTRQRSQVLALFLALCFGARAVAADNREKQEIERLERQLAQVRMGPRSS